VSEGTVTGGTDGGAGGGTADVVWFGTVVRLEVEGGIGTIRLDRPKVNALDAAMQEEIREAAGLAAASRDVAAVVVYGGERAFAAGADIKEMQAMSYVDMVERSAALQSSFTAVARIRNVSLVYGISGPSSGLSPYNQSPVASVTNAASSARSSSLSSEMPSA